MWQCWEQNDKSASKKPAKGMDKQPPPPPSVLTPTTRTEKDPRKTEIGTVDLDHTFVIGTAYGMGTTVIRFILSVLLYSDNGDNEYFSFFTPFLSVCTGTRSEEITEFHIDSTFKTNQEIGSGFPVAYLLVKRPTPTIPLGENSDDHEREDSLTPYRVNAIEQFLQAL
ncbi:hypothetical protein DM01DRAFT_1343785 [Hesseltinella vesiculosa]|uniref:Uncharacterized protein n=1 Tax=Hesseltinella vesiculosa TaxID=101127 RepID=A0A1X2GQF5_9FUNG|nr:hypothetical protein DM01DRAFT_1343785 [Hesseltinella vesiculosa]